MILKQVHQPGVLKPGDPCIHSLTLEMRAEGLNRISSPALDIVLFSHLQQFEEGFIPVTLGHVRQVQLRHRNIQNVSLQEMNPT